MSTLPGQYGDPRRAEPDIAPTPPPASDLVRLLNVVLRNRRLLLWVPVAVAAFVGLMMLFQPRKYRSEASFVSQRAQGTPLAFSGLAAQFGVALPNSGLEQSPAFYADLLRSREILGRVVEATYPAGASGEVTSLIDAYDIDEDDPNVRVHLAIEQLRGSMDVSNDLATGVVGFSVATQSPSLARAVAEKIISEINTFNLTRRQSAAEAERAFVEERLDAANKELAAAEMALRRFDEQNLRIDNSPHLRLERDRLERQVSMRQEVVTMLAQAYEQARIDEVRNTPAITVVERPSVPVKPEPRGTVRFSLLAFLVSGFIMTCFVFSRELYRGIATGETPAHESFRELSRSMRIRLPGRRGK